MAGALDNDPINQLEKNLQCSVCLEVLTDPRTLPCCHSFCKKCLERTVETCRGKASRGQPIRKFPCPNCRVTFILDPDKHVADMPRNHFICNMVNVAAVLDRETRVPCSHNCSQSYSVARCVTCEKFLCKECLTGHNNYRGNNEHSVLTMEELSKPENRKKINDKMYCNEHSGMELKVYCETCDQLICRDCMDFKHVKKGHSCLLVKDEANEYKELVASNNKAIEDALTEGNVFLQRLKLTTEQLNRDAENIRTQIVQKKDIVLETVTEMLEEKTRTLLEKVDDIRKAEQAKVEKQAEETKLYVEKIKTSAQFSKNLVDQGTEEEIVSSQKMMLDNAKNLLKNREKYFKAPIPVAKLSYSSSTGEEQISKYILRELEDSLGDVNFKDEDVVKMQPQEVDSKLFTQKEVSRKNTNVNGLYLITPLYQREIPKVKDRTHINNDGVKLPRESENILGTREECLETPRIARLGYTSSTCEEAINKAFLRKPGIRLKADFKDEDGVDSDEESSREKKDNFHFLKESRKLNFTNKDSFDSDKVDSDDVDSKREKNWEKNDILHIPRDDYLKNEDDVKMQPEEVGSKRFSKTGSSWEKTEREKSLMERLFDIPKAEADVFASPGKKPANDDERLKDDKCPICFRVFTKKKTLDKCGHSFCTKCIRKAFKTKKQCPLCFKVYA